MADDNGCGNGQFRWEFDKAMRNYHLRFGELYVGHFYPDDETGVDIDALLAAMASPEAVALMEAGK